MERDDQPGDESVEDVHHRQRLIGKEIRKFYDSSVKSDLPPPLRALLHQLDEKEKRNGGT